MAASRGLSVQNFTTSFSDGQIFKAILDEYEHFLIEGRSAAIVPLHQRLRTLGCNAQFSNPFGTKHGRSQIFGKDFVLAVLTFLCSRLLAPSKVCRKAVVMQKSWRRYLQATLSERQAVKRDLAKACSAYVQSKMAAANSCTGLDPVVVTPKGPITRIICGYLCNVTRLMCC